MLALAWSLAPIEEWRVLRRAEGPRRTDAPSHDDSAEVRAPLDASAFEVQLWNAPPKPVGATAPRPTPAPPLNLDLIAIISESNECKAALYERASDRLHVVAPGARIGRLEVLRVDASGVELRDGDRVLRLSLAREADPVTTATGLISSGGDEP